MDLTGLPTPVDPNSPGYAEGLARARIAMATAIRDIAFMGALDDAARLRGTLVQLRDKGMLMGLGRPLLSAAIESLDMALAKARRGQQLQFEAEDAAPESTSIEQLLSNA